MATIGTIEFCRRVHRPLEETVVIDYQRAEIRNHRDTDPDQALMQSAALPSIAVVSEMGIQIYQNIDTPHASMPPCVSAEFIVDSLGNGFVRHTDLMEEPDAAVPPETLDTHTQIMTFNEREMYERQTRLAQGPNGISAFLTIRAYVDLTPE